MNKLILSTLLITSFSNSCAMETKKIAFNGKKIEQDLVLKTIERLKKLKEQKPQVFYKMIQRCRSNSLQAVGCHKYGCPKGGVVISRCGLNFHNFDVCRIIIECVKIDGINYNIVDPFSVQEEYFV